jgi:predicted glutamine amidotransferase
MCIAIKNAANSVLPQTWVKNSWDNNGDGAGLLWLQDGKLQVFKEMMSFVTYWEKYLEIKSTCPESNVLLHFRISTHGKIDHTNCHPFLVDETIGFIHNGMIHQVERHNDFSDTYMFNETILKHLPKGFEKNPAINELIHEYIDSNKLVFLNTDNEVTIINEKAGHWVGNDWFSNSSYKMVNDWYDYGGIKKYKSYAAPTTMGYTAPTKKYDDWRDWEDPTADGTNKITDTKCKECGLHLYEDEVVNGYCVDCVREIKEQFADDNGYGDVDEFDYEWAYVSKCECCERDEVLVAWDTNFQASICNDCHDDIYTEIIAERDKDRVVQTNHYHKL